MQWSDLYTARVSLADAAMCMNLINESLFTISHCDFLLWKHNYALHIPDWKFSEGGR